MSADEAKGEGSKVISVVASGAEPNDVSDMAVGGIRDVLAI